MIGKLGKEVKALKKILIVEDDQLLNRTLAYNLTSDGYEVISVFNFDSAVPRDRAVLNRQVHVRQRLAIQASYSIHAHARVFFSASLPGVPAIPSATDRSNDLCLSLIHICISDVYVPDGYFDLHLLV